MSVLGCWPPAARDPERAKSPCSRPPGGGALSPGMGPHTCGVFFGHLGRAGDPGSCWDYEL